MIFRFFCERPNELLGDSITQQARNNVMPTLHGEPAYLGHEAANMYKINTIQPYIANF